ncbi:MAG: DUF2268 domain-containing putative Zn-dependent protease [Bacteroidota bacterium]
MIRLKTTLSFKNFLLIALIFPAVISTAQQREISDPKKAKFIISDIDNFWQMYDKLSLAKSQKDSLTILRMHYLDKASKGLKKYFEVERNENNRSTEDIENSYLSFIGKHPKYFNSIRNATLSIKNLKPEFLKTFEKLKDLYPNFKFPDAYFAIGFANMGGRSFPGGEMYIGAEIFATADSANYEEFGEDQWLSRVSMPVESTHLVLAHEYTHGQQKLPPKGTNSLLTLALMEGSAVFIAGLATNGKSLIGGAGFSEHALGYGEIYEEEVWDKFKADMREQKDSNWFYNAETEEFPKDMGYYVGFKICQSYYQNAKDKKQAIKEIVELNDYDSFLEESRYNEKFK